MVGGDDSEELDRITIGDLNDLVGPHHVLVDQDVSRRYAIDWTGRFVGQTPAVVRPGSTREVAGVLALCHERGIRVVPQGGNTGLVGGSVPLDGELVLNLTRLKRLDPVDVGAAQVTAGAGVTISDLSRHVSSDGFVYPVDLGSRDSATVGGTVATNAGGMHVMRWGDTRDQVMGFEAVLADGTTIEHLGGLVKDNTGYDLGGLLCGSEGTLAVVTAVRVRLVRRPQARAVALVAFGDVATAVTAAGQLRDRVPELTALELIPGVGLDLVCVSEGITPPFATSRPVHLLVEVAGGPGVVDDLGSVVVEIPSVLDVAVAQDERGCGVLWSYRELLTVAINRIGPPHKLDVTLPNRHLVTFFETVADTVASVRPGARVWLFGHIGDGNIHVNITGVDPGDSAIDAAVFERVASLEGSISAEHGIGNAKKQWLHLNRRPAEIDAFRRIKSALDPAGILNPNVLLP